MEPGPLKSAMEKTEGVIKQVLITYRVRDGQLLKESVSRNYTTDGDYTDSCFTEPLINLKGKN